MRINRLAKLSQKALFFTALLSAFGAAEFPVVKPGQFDPFDSTPFKLKEFDVDKDVDKPIEDVLFEEIRKVKDREYQIPEQERRLPIVKIIIEGVVPHPDMGITQELIQTEIDKQFVKEQARDRDLNGFTKRDLNDIGAFLRDLIDRGGIRSGANKDDIAALLELIRVQEHQETWITLEQLDAIALMVTEYYRERGFILATAFIPEQEVSDGIIRVNVLEGRLGDVIVTNNKIFDADTISAAFSDEIGEPVTEQRVESALRRINDLPGVQVRGSFSPGDNVGETRLNLGVLNEKSRNTNVLLDNHGTEATGVTRVFATTEWLNIGNRGHRLLVGVLASEGPDSSVYGIVDYEMPLLKNKRGKVKLSASTNVFSVARSLTIPEIVGETDNFSVTGTYQLARSRIYNQSVQVGFTYKDVLFDVGGISSLSTDQQIGVLSVSTDYTRLWDDQQLLFTGRLGIDQGQIYNGSVQDQSANFTKTLATMNLLKRFSLENWFTKKESSYNLIFKANVQYAEKFLSSVEQFSLGGPNAVRAFSVSDISVDSGAYAGVELFFDLPFDITKKLKLPLDPVKPYVFFDYAYGVARRPGGGDNKDAQIKGYGFGLRFNWSGKGTANLIFATPKSTSFDDGFSEAEGKSRIYFDVNYQVH